MKIFALLLASLLCLSIASAVPDNVITGPYKVSFDLGLPSNTYTVETAPPKNTESLSGNKSTDYNIKITKGLTNAIVTITCREDKQMVLSPEDLEKAMGMAFLYNDKIRNIDYATRNIDGVTGVIFSCDYYINYALGYIETYQLEYYPNFDPEHLTCIITSNIPWDEGTLQLLNTIHIEPYDSTTSTIGPEQWHKEPYIGSKYS